MLLELDYPGRVWKPFGQPPGDMCKICRAYYQKLYEEGVTNKPFPITCKGKCTDGLELLTVSDFASIDDYYDFMIAKDPVTWAKREFNWEPRWYQIWSLECTSLLQVLRQGRRVGKTYILALKMLYRAIHNERFPILVICPYESQVAKIFNVIKEFISLSVSCKEMVHRDVMNPHRIEFTNGAYIAGFTAGAKSGARSDKIRGEDAKMVVLDEMDYLEDKELTAVLAILASHPECEILASSTPTGEHKLFYTWCTVKNTGFKERHIISQESPSWSKVAEDVLLATYDQSSIEHELYADWGSQELGVFKNHFIDPSLEDYKLSECAPIPGAVYGLGVDWNEVAGTHIVCTQWYQGKYRPVARKVVKGKEFTQTASVLAIIEMWQRWNPRFLYADAGYGKTQIEMIKNYGVHNKMLRMAENTKAIEMGGKIEIRDPLTDGLVKKHNKQFMVNQTALQLECGRLVLPKAEDGKIRAEIGHENTSGLVEQMRNFKIDHYGINGQPIYSQGEDHTLTAFMLSIMGFVLEMSDLTQYTSDSRVLFPNKAGTAPVPTVNEVKKTLGVTKNIPDRNLMIHGGKGSIGGSPTLQQFHARRNLLRGGLPRTGRTDFRRRRSW